MEEEEIRVSFGCTRLVGVRLLALHFYTLETSSNLKLVDLLVD